MHFRTTNGYINKTNSSKYRKKIVSLPECFIIKKNQMSELNVYIFLICHTIIKFCLDVSLIKFNF